VDIITVIAEISRHKKLSHQEDFFPLINFPDSRFSKAVRATPTVLQIDFAFLFLQKKAYKTPIQRFGKWALHFC
jgi:hypothetical protein